MQTSTKQRLKNAAIGALSMGSIGALVSKTPGKAALVGGTVGALIGALEDPRKQQEIDDLIDLKEKKAQVITQIHVGSFFDELEKISSAGLELAGLGVLAAPSVKTLTDSKASKKEKSHAKFETAGLGILAAHPAYEIGKKLLTKKAATVSNAAMMKNHMLVDSQRAAGKPQTQAAPALMKKDPSHYSDFMPSTSVGHQPVQRAAPAMRSSVALPSAGPVRSAARPQAMGVMARIANTFKKA